MPRNRALWKLPLAALAATLILAGCASEPEGAPAGGALSGGAPAGGVPSAEAPAAAPAPREVASGGTEIGYLCDRGRKVSARYGRDTASVTYQGVTYDLEQAISASGVRYIGAGLEWWTKGPEGTLSRLGTSERLAANCRAER